jgi:hypothetical protein
MGYVLFLFIDFGISGTGIDALCLFLSAISHDRSW